MNDNSRLRDRLSFSRANISRSGFFFPPCASPQSFHSPGLTPTLLFGCSSTAPNPRVVAFSPLQSNHSSASASLSAPIKESDWLSGRFLPHTYSSNKRQEKEIPVDVSPVAIPDM